jgi:Transposase
MKHCAGLDVSVKETAICIVDESGKIVREAKVTTEPEAIVEFLKAAGFEYARVGLEAGPMSQWIVTGLLEAGLPVVCVETRHMKAVLKAQQVNKSDRNDARGIAQMMRVGLYKPVHVKTLVSQQERMLLTARKLLRDKLQDIENELRGTLRNFGLRVGVVSTGHFEARVRELVVGHPPLEAIVAPLLAVRRVLRGHRQLVASGQLNLRQRRWNQSSLQTDTADFGPDLEFLGPGGSVLGGSDMITAKMEQVVDLIVGGEEPLRLAGRFELLHLPLSSARRLVRVFRSVVEPLVLAMLDARHHLSSGRAVAGKLVGDHDAGRSHLLLQQLA